MKTIATLAMLMLLGCAHRSNQNQGGAPANNAFESGPRADPELPYRTGPGLPRTERDYPRREVIQPGD